MDSILLMYEPRLRILLDRLRFQCTYTYNVILLLLSSSSAVDLSYMVLARTMAKWTLGHCCFGVCVHRKANRSSRQHPAKTGRKCKEKIDCPVRQTSLQPTIGQPIRLRYGHSSLIPRHNVLLLLPSLFSNIYI